MISQEVCQTEDKTETPKKTAKNRYKAEQCQTCGSKIVYVNRSRPVSYTHLTLPTNREV